MKKLLGLLFSAFFPFFAGLLSIYFLFDSYSWYSSINQPLFGVSFSSIVSGWFLSYFFTGLSLYCIWDKKPLNQLWLEVSVYLAQLLLSVIWFMSFFKFQNPSISFIEMFFLLPLVSFFSLRFYKVNKKTAYFLVPYLLWISFVAIINFSIVILN